MDELHHNPSSAIVPERMSSYPQQQQQKQQEQQEQQEQQQQNSGFGGDSSDNSNNIKASAAALASSRRVSLDTSMSYGNFSKSSARNNQPSSSSRPMPSIQADFVGSTRGGGAMGDPSMNALAPIPPVGGYLPRMNRRGSDPGFYSRENPLPPFAPSPHLPGMNYLPFPAMPASSRRSTLGGGFSGNNNNCMQFPGPSGGMMMPSVTSMDGGFPSMNLNDSSSAGMDGSCNSGMDDLSQRNVPYMGMGPSMDTATPKRSRPSGVASFPMKLHRILSSSAYSEYIAWLPHGRAWRILKQKTFEKEVIPKFFRSARYASFMRQVNGWGFKRIVEGADLNAYYHESFLRGLPELCAEMRRPQKGKGKEQSNKVKDSPAPDFYKISLIAPLPPSQDLQSTEPSRPSLTPRSLRPRQHTAPLAANHCDLTTDYDEDFKPPMTPRNRLCEQQEEHQYCREQAMTPTMRGGNEISPMQEAFLSCTPMADVASVSSDFDNQGDHWGDSPFSPYHGAPGAATTAAPSGSDSQQDKPQAIPSSNGDDFLAVPTEVKIMSPGASLRSSPIGGAGDKDFLTKADLTYLEHQNQFLLEQSRMFDGGPPQQPDESTSSPKEHRLNRAPSDQLLGDLHEEGPLDSGEEQG